MYTKSVTFIVLIASVGHRIIYIYIYIYIRDHSWFLLLHTENNIEKVLKEIHYFKEKKA